MFIIIYQLIPIFSFISPANREAGKAPHFTQKPIIKQPQKNQLTMTCNLESSSQPVIKWFREATEIKQGGRYTIQTTKDPKGPNMYIIVLTIKVSFI